MTAVSSDTSGRQEPNFEPLPAEFAEQTERTDLPTERDILSGMEIASSLLTGTRPQANLVPQQQNTVGPVGTLLPGDSDEGTARKSEAGQSATWVTSVCTGAMVLHRAGFLTGRPATTHWGAIHELKALGDVDVKEGVRWVHDGNVITSAGVSAGIDMALYLVSLLKNEQISASVQKMMEYYPQPPVFDEVPA